MKIEQRIIVLSGIGVLNRFGNTCSALPNTVPLAEAAAEDWFEPEQYLGRHGYKYLLSSCRYGLAATKLAIDDAGIGGNTYCGDRVGVVIGTNFANYQFIAELDAITREGGAEGIKPMAAPNFSVNLAASNISIKHGFRAFNLTLTNPMVAGIEAVAVAARSILDDRADAIVAGALEGAPPQRVESELGIVRSEAGAAVFFLETSEAAQQRGCRPYTVIRSARSFSFSASRITDADSIQRLRKLVGKNLEAMEFPQGRKLRFCALSLLTPFHRMVDELATEWLSRRGEVERIEAFGGDGRFLSVSPVLLISHLAATYGEGLVMAMSPFGQVHLLALSKYPAVAAVGQGQLPEAHG